MLPDRLSAYPSKTSSSLPPGPGVHVANVLLVRGEPLVIKMLLIIDEVGI